MIPSKLFFHYINHQNELKQNNLMSHIYSMLVIYCFNFQFDHHKKILTFQVIEKGINHLGHKYYLKIVLSN